MDFYFIDIGGIVDRHPNVMLILYSLFSPWSEDILYIA